MSMSSLQRASFQKSNMGGFESSFADGLNLSEFSSIVDSSRNTQASSAVLLREKRKQAAQNTINDREDARIELIAKERAEKLRESLSISNQQRASTQNDSPLRATAPWENTGNDLVLNRMPGAAGTSAIGGLITSMHGNDLHGGQKEPLRHKITKKQAKRFEKCVSGRRTVTKSKKKDRKVTKKAKLTKYGR
mmetsp:Transcript_19338/g.29130  ORF Transcript_19338/g.29130 Transcript_19338/m.29130 type:complete len:192 (+) Transcript_19338:82-657(+)|eukprot:CAMPEP_0178904168 /NCGR_PEP_ID=MMETSP0786-20121207/5549_1 /TAXON_ID=186022 /ORGANISM="Thalassionema frauenfeldii, Strain CCMP 1798" /LENGTH=191 /DNA_ID=CAMNT_0020575593 /DNA_START=6 /DNA_END=581 /DNA_ORIENTATION=+